VFAFFSHSEHLGTFFCGKAAKKPGFPLQFLAPPAAGLRDFRCNPLCPTGYLRFAQFNAIQ
jgi:hypothetical protein